MELYPLLMAPYFRSGSETPWGGSMLRDAFLKDCPEQTGESLEISALPGCESLVRSGSSAGKSLRAMIDLWGASLTGCEGDAFPLLLKLIDAGEDLPAQAAPEGTSAAWMILNCDPGSRLTCGTGEAVRVKPGDVCYIPAGMACGIGAGIQLYEIRSTSGGACTGSAEPALKRIFGTTSLCKGGSRTYYVSDGAVELCRLNVSGKMPVDDGRMLFLTPLGPCTLTWGDQALELMPFDSVLLPAALKGVCVESEDCKVLLSAVSDRAKLRDELGYRAENVAGMDA